MTKAKKPKKFDYNLIVIGAGSAGLVSSLIAAAIKSKVALVEKHRMGGDCLNTGCVPSKALIRSSKIISYIKRAKEFGFDNANVNYDFSKVMDRVQGIIKKIEPHDSVERFTKLGVDCYIDSAEIIDRYRVRIGKEEYTTQNIIIATGASPFVPPLKGIEKINFYTSDTIWDIRKKPKSLMVLGGGPIGCELSQAFNQFDIPITNVTMDDSLLPREDNDVSGIVVNKFKKEGINVLTNHKAKEFVVEGNKKFLICEVDGKESKIEFDEILLAIGRRANIKGFGAENIGLKISNRGTVEANEYLQTNYNNIFVCGDVVGPYQFTHTASHQAWYAAVNSLFSGIKKFKVDYRIIPWATFTSPEVAKVGLSEKEAKDQNISYEVTKYEFSELDRAIADSEEIGFIKVLTVPGKDTLLGVTIVGTHAGDLIAEYVLAMKYNIGLNKILGTIHIYPTLGELNKGVAGVWKKNHAPQFALKMLEKFFKWRRKG